MLPTSSYPEPNLHVNLPNPAALQVVDHPAAAPTVAVPQLDPWGVARTPQNNIQFKYVEELEAGKLCFASPTSGFDLSD